MNIYLNSNSFLFYNNMATSENYTLSLHDALPISRQIRANTISFTVFPEIVPSIGNSFINTWNNFWKDGDRKSGSAGMPRPISYAVFCLKKKKQNEEVSSQIKLVKIVRHGAKQSII